MARQAPARKSPKKAPASRNRSKPRELFSFDFLGFLDGWYALRANLRQKVGIDALDALTFDNSVVEWLIANRITPNKWSYIANGNTGDGPFVPALMDGNGLCVLLKRPADVLRFESRFPCTGITPESILAALRAEASVVRISVDQIAQVAYDAYRKLSAIYDQTTPTWDDATDSDRKMFVDGVTTQQTNPAWTAAQVHDHWVQDRMTAGWSFGPKRDSRNKTHPNMIPFARLAKLEKAKREMFRSVVMSLLPLMEDE